MKTLAVAAAGAALFGSAVLLPVATEAQNASSGGVPGFLNPSTGLFTARPALLPAASGLQRSGTLTVTITAVLGSNIPAAIPVFCEVDLSATDIGFENTAYASGTLTRSGTGGTCKINVPYTFEIAAPSTALHVYARISATTTTSPTINYGAEFGFSPFPVPNSNKRLTVKLAM